MNLDEKQFLLNCEASKANSYQLTQPNNGKLPLRHCTLFAGLPKKSSSKIYTCPSAKKPGDGTDATALSATSYLPNAVVMERNLAQIPRPSEIIFIQET